MKPRYPLVIDERTVNRIVQDILNRRPGYVPEWLPTEKGPGAFITQIAARYLRTIIERLNQSPEKNKLAFLDLLGIELIPAQSARAPVVFQISEQSSDGRVLAGTRLAAPPPPETTDQIVFETERTAGLASARINEVISLWPGRDQYINHSSDFLEGTPFQPFKKSQLNDTPHILYIAHDTLLALAGRVRLDLEFELTQSSNEHLNIIWEYWDGKVWRGFKSIDPSCESQGENLDGTNGLQQSGRVRLEADCAETEKRLVNEIEAFWIRGRLNEPLPPERDQILPEVNSIRLSSVVERPLPFIGDCNAIESMCESNSNDVGEIRDEKVEITGLFPDIAFANRTELDLTVPFFPYGNNPQPMDAFYFSSEEIFSKPGAQVEILSCRTETPQDRIELIGSPARIILDIGPLIAPGGGSDIPNQRNIHVIVRDSNDNPVLNGTRVIVTTSFGTFEFGGDRKSIELFTHEIEFNDDRVRGAAEITLFLPPSFGDTLAIIEAQSGLVHCQSDEFDFLDDQTHTCEFNLTEDTSILNPVVRWEYFDGRIWKEIQGIRSECEDDLSLDNSTLIRFEVPFDMVQTNVNDQERLWVRARLVKGGFGFTQILNFFDNESNAPNQTASTITQPPALSEFRLGYTWQFGPFHPEYVQTFNDFQYEDHTEEARLPGSTFQPFTLLQDITPALYLGFNKKLPVDRLNLFFDIEENKEDIKGPALVWEFWNGFNWKDLTVQDETNDLRVPGILSFIGPEESQSLARFGTSLYWLRGRLKEDGPPGEPTVHAIYPNTVFVSQMETITDDPLGTSNGQPNQVFTFVRIPILEEERIEVRELFGQRANVEWRIVAMTLFEGNNLILQELEGQLRREGDNRDIQMGKLRLRRDRNKRVVEVWVQWESRENLLLSGPDDRHYVLERSRGRLSFGDGDQGKIPPLGADILARQYRTGGGRAGNVAAQTITQLQASVGGVESVFNPKPAESGSDSETLEVLSTRGPRTLRHRGRAITARDYETMAMEASPAVAFARTIPTYDILGQIRPGWVTLIIIPHSNEPRPQPSFGLREKVTTFIEEHTAASVAAAERIIVIGPEYQPVDVEATIVPVELSQAGIVENSARETLENFFHPINGGPERRGWELGRDVFYSDVASELERVEGIDYVKELILFENGALRRERVKVEEDKIVVAGQIRLIIKAQ
jgi:hypothetical protein